jgi:hypothetical protein
LDRQLPLAPANEMGGYAVDIGKNTHLLAKLGESILFLGAVA